VLIFFKIFELSLCAINISYQGACYAGGRVFNPL